MSGSTDQISPSVIRRAKAGDRDAIAELMCVVETPIQVVVSRITHADQRDDAAQELRIRVMQSIDRFDERKSAWTTFVRGRLRFMLTDYFRSSYPLGLRSRTHPEIREQVTVGSLDACGGGVQDAVDDASTERHSQVDSLDVLEVLERHSDLLECALWARGHTMREVGDRLGITESAVSLRMRRARSLGLGEYVSQAAGLDSDTLPSCRLRGAS